MKIIYLILYWIGRLEFEWFGSTNKYSYLAFRQLHGLTNGGINESYSRQISGKKGKYEFPEITKGILGAMDSSDINEIVSWVRRNGYLVFDRKLPEEICDRMLAKINDMPSNPIVEGGKLPKTTYDSAYPKAPIYRFDEEDILANNDILGIFYDLNFIRIAQEYLGCKPLNNSIIMWWSSLLNKAASSRAAQLYHFDMDHPKFIKFFIYLTDVDTNSGPHCYVQGTHRSKHSNLIKDRRYSDEEILDSFESSDIIEVLGSKGTVVAVDTSGIHKGKLPTQKDRLIIQVEYTNSFFGQKVMNPDVAELPKFEDPEIRKMYKEVLRRLRVANHV